MIDQLDKEDKSNFRNFQWVINYDGRLKAVEDLCWLLVFYGISTLVSYLMPHPVYIYIYTYKINL